MSSVTAIADNVKEFVDSTIAENDVVVFSKSWCPYSKKTKATLATLNTEGKKVKIIDIDLDFGQPFGEGAVQDYLQQKTGQRTVPNTFIRQEHIGGNDKFQEKGTVALQKLIDGPDSATGSAGTVEEFVESTIAENDVVVFAKSWCQYSKKTKATLATLNTDGKKVKIIDIDLDFGQPFGESAVQDYLQAKTGQRTVPNTFIRQQHIGGNDKFQEKGTVTLQKLIDGTE